MDIEDVTEDKILRTKIDYVKGLPVYDGIDIAARAGISNELLNKTAEILSAMIEVFTKNDCTTLEINPLILTKDGQLLAGDCRMSIDENASFRHPELKVDIPREFPREPTDFEHPRAGGLRRPISGVPDS